MLPRKNRISRKDFPARSVQEFRVFSPFFSAVFYQTNEKSLHTKRVTRHGSGAPSADSESHATIVVSKKTVKTAVSRNVLRRRFYDLLVPYFKNISIQTTVVIYPKAEATKVQFAVLKSEMEKAFKQAKLIK